MNQQHLSNLSDFFHCQTFTPYGITSEVHLSYIVRTNYIIYGIQKQSGCKNVRPSWKHQSIHSYHVENKAFVDSNNSYLKSLKFSNFAKNILAIKIKYYQGVLREFTQNLSSLPVSTSAILNLKLCISDGKKGFLHCSASF